MSENATSDKTNLIAEYEKITGKKNGKFLTNEQLSETIMKYRMTSDTIEELVPVFKGEHMYGIINGKYIPWKEAEILHQEKIVAREILILEKLKNDNLSI